MDKKDIYRDLYEDLDRASPERLRYSEKAFGKLPHIPRPQILDVGCGQGGITLRLALLSEGKVFGVDNDKTALNKLRRRAEQKNLSDKVRIIKCSMKDMEFPDNSFDIIWAEGSIHIIGFERGIKDWKRFLKPNGFLVIHEMTWLLPDPPQEISDYWQRAFPDMQMASKYIEMAIDAGYHHVDDFPLPHDFWWRDYYSPMQTQIIKLRKRYTGNREAIEILDSKQQEVELFNKYSQWYGSGFYLFQKIKK